MTDNDRLLELAGGCRHEWVDSLRADSTGLAWSYPLIPHCIVCDWWYYNGNNPPVVGDGHQMTLGEMVRLVDELWPAREEEEYFCQTGGVELWRDPNGDWIAVLCKPGDYLTQAGADNPELALARAIIAAVDGEPQ